MKRETEMAAQHERRQEAQVLQLRCPSRLTAATQPPACCASRQNESTGRAESLRAYLRRKPNGGQKIR
jgi:hypothetical protein